MRRAIAILCLCAGLVLEVNCLPKDLPLPETAGPKPTERDGEKPKPQIKVPPPVPVPQTPEANEAKGLYSYQRAEINIGGTRIYDAKEELNRDQFPKMVAFLRVDLDESTTETQFTIYSEGREIYRLSVWGELFEKEHDGTVWHEFVSIKESSPFPDKSYRLTEHSEFVPSRLGLRPDSYWYRFFKNLFEQPMPTTLRLFDSLPPPHEIRIRDSGGEYVLRAASDPLFHVQARPSFDLPRSLAFRIPADRTPWRSDLSVTEVFVNDLNLVKEDDVYLFDPVAFWDVSTSEGPVLHVSAKLPCEVIAQEIRSRGGVFRTIAPAHPIVRVALDAWAGGRSVRSDWDFDAQSGDVAIPVPRNVSGQLGEATLRFFDKSGTLLLEKGPFAVPDLEAP